MLKKIKIYNIITKNDYYINDNWLCELFLCVASMIVGGEDAKTLFDGEGFDFVKNAVNLELKNNYQLGKDLILEYYVSRRIRWK